VGEQSFGRVHVITGSSSLFERLRRHHGTWVDRERARQHANGTV